MRVPGLKSLRQVTRWLRSRVTDSALILGYHRVVGREQDPYGLCVSPTRFEEQLRLLRRYARPTSLQELLGVMEKGGELRGRVVLTFDDGYADTLYRAKPLLEKYEVPATVFVATGFLGKTFWWDELSNLILYASTIPNLELLKEVDGWLCTS